MQPQGPSSEARAGGQDTRTRAGWVRALWILWAVLLVLGIVGVVLRLTQGHLPAGYGSYVPWGLWVALYFHGVGIAGGAFVLGALGYMLNVPGFRQRTMLRATIVLSIAAVLPSFLGVWLDLGRMDRAYRIFTAPTFTSMMAFNAWMYNGFILVAAIAWALSYRRDTGWLKPVLALGVFLSILFPSQSGAFFGVVDAKPYWHSALLPMLFLTSALTAGAATLLVVRALLGPGGSTEGDREEYQAAIARLRIATLVGMVVYFVFEFAEFSTAFWNPASDAPALRLVLFGPYWWVFWIVHLLLGGVIPLALLSLPRREHWTLAALLVAVTFISARLNILVPGQAVGEIRGLQEAFQHPRLKYIYHATPMEYLVGAFLLAVGIAIFVVGCHAGARVAARYGTEG